MTELIEECVLKSIKVRDSNFFKENTGMRKGECK